MFFCIVYRTEKHLDKVARALAAVAITMFVATILEMDRYLGLLPDEYSNIIFAISRFIGLGFLVIALGIFLRITNDVAKKKQDDQK